MSIVKILDDVTAWVQENICDKIKLKAPPDDDTEAVDAGYEYRLVTPAAFSLFVPTKDKLPPAILAPIPSLCVRFMEGSDALDGSSGSINLQFAFSTWDVGLHSRDIFYKLPDGSFKRGAKEADFFKLTGSGWRDAWNFVDLALREIESTTSIAGYELDRSTAVQYGPLAEQENIPDYYPFWFCWVNFTLKYPLIRNVDDIQKYL